jgi:BirA family transcriptional regulator, biotin operon repressor / biotin---[acetyl-CoA-carboxylase] ligase
VSTSASDGGEIGLAPRAALGRPRLHLRETDSTNERARLLALGGAPHGTLVTASFQTAGRGRLGRRWVAPPGSALLMSLVLRGEPDRLAMLPLIAAVAVCDVTGPRALIKWPNDVVLERAPGPRGATRAGQPESDQTETAPAPALAKLAGILTEGRPQERWAVLGIGLNVAVWLRDLPDGVRRTAATLGLEPTAIEPTLEQLLAALQERLETPREALLEAWQERDALRGREIAWGPSGAARPGGRAACAEVSGGRGRAEGIDGAGHLLVRLQDGARTSLDAGEVRLENPP